jgi:hypothetical protein
MLGNNTFYMAREDGGACRPTIACSESRLLHNLRKRRIDERTVKWIASFLANRTTVISFDSFESDVYRTATGIPQGSPLSPILYLCDDYGSAGLCSMQHLRFLKITTRYSLRSFCVNLQLPRYGRGFQQIKHTPLVRR